MRSIILIAALAAVVTLMSCTKSQNEVYKDRKDAVLGVNPTLPDVPATRATISNFPESSEIGLFVTTGLDGNHYNDVLSNYNVKLTYSGDNSWSMSPAVYLSSNPATVFAYYPYNSSSNNRAGIPIEHTSQTDYLYGTHTPGQGVINSDNATVNLTMKHALSLIQFRINKENYTGPGVVTKIEVTNKRRNVLYSEGIISIETGAFIGISERNAAAFIQNISGLYTLQSAFPTTEYAYLKVMVLPVRSLENAGDVAINFMIDGKVYSFEVPAGTAWNSGEKNTYTVTLAGSELKVGTVAITDWVNGTNGSATLQ